LGGIDWRIRNGKGEKNWEMNLEKNFPKNIDN
jgi:hypothetical protein